MIEDQESVILEAFYNMTELEQLALLHLIRNDDPTWLMDFKNDRVTAFWATVADYYNSNGDA